MNVIDMFPLVFVLTVFLSITGNLLYQYIQAVTMND